jgi:hypothetical protein
MEQLTLESSPTYTVYYDPSKRVVTNKIKALCEAYEEKFGIHPTTVLCSAEDAQHVGEVPGVTVEARHYVARNMFYVGGEE